MTEEERENDGKTDLPAFGSLVNVEFLMINKALFRTVLLPRHSRVGGRPLFGAEEPWCHLHEIPAFAGMTEKKREGE